MSDILDKDDLLKMKVPDLKKELKLRGLSTDGKKNELIERLQIAIGDSALLDDALVDHDDILDEDVLSDEESEDLIKTELEKSPIEPEIKSTTTPPKRKAESAGDVKIAKKIVLNRNVLSITENVTTKVAQKDTSEENGTREAVKSKKAVNFPVGVLSNKERLEKRAAKFGVTMSVDAKKEARAARFGLPTADSKVGGLVNTSVDVLKKRAERFGGTLPESNLSKIAWEERKQKRMERFGKVETTTTAKVTLDKKQTSKGNTNEKLQQRAQRFQLKSK